MILLLGEITSKAVVDYQKIVRETVRKIGYDDTTKGNLNFKVCHVNVMVCCLPLMHVLIGFMYWVGQLHGAWLSLQLMWTHKTTPETVILLSTLFWYQLLYFLLTCSFTHHFFLF